MNCFFDHKKFCPLTDQNIPVINMGRFCQACIGRDTISKSIESMKAGLILSMLRMFPEEDKAKAEYQKLMKRVEEW